MNNLNHGRWLVVGLWFLLASTATSRADQGWEGPSLAIDWENDAFAGADRHYTQGIKINYLSGDNRLPRWARWLSDHLPAPGMDKRADKFGLGIGQAIYTPEDLRSTTVVRNDRPYAGWLYGSALLRRRGQTSRQWPVMETIRLDLGFVGPESLAEEAQKTFHAIEPQGWANQLTTEPGVVLRYDRRYLVSWSRAGRQWAVDWIPNCDVNLGNVDLSAGIGTLLRWGWQVPDEFEVPAGPTPLRCGFYFFGGVEGRVVGRNVFLDGNTWQDSHRVDKETLIGSVKVGVTLVLKRLELSFTQVLLSKEFQRQGKRDTYSSMSLAYKF